MDAIQSLPDLKNFCELRKAPGIITNMGPFILKLSNLTAPLRELVKSEQREWTASQSHTFQKVKDVICHETCLTYFDPQKFITLQVDTTTKGLGDCPMQDNKPNAFTSKSLSEVVQQ